MRQSLISMFTEHPNSVGESYFSHLVSASGFACKMIVGGFACLLHGLLPFLFVRTGSQLITNLHHSMVLHRHKNSAGAVPLDGDKTTTEAP